MSEIGRVDRAILLLKARLSRLAERKTETKATGISALRQTEASHLAAIRKLAGRKGIEPRDLRRAMVRGLLVESLGDELAAGLEFNTIVDRIAVMLETDETGLDLLNRALAELG